LQEKNKEKGEWAVERHNRMNKLLFINTAGVEINILHETSRPRFAPVSARSATTFEKHGARKTDLQIGLNPTLLRTTIKHKHWTCSKKSIKYCTKWIWVLEKMKKKLMIYK
jgi:hypothetical protein